MVVGELLRWRAPMMLVAVCVLLGFHPGLQQSEDSASGCGYSDMWAALWFLCFCCCPLEDNDFVEIFAGDAEVTAKLRQELAVVCAGVVPICKAV